MNTNTQTVNSTIDLWRKGTFETDNNALGKRSVVYGCKIRIGTVNKMISRKKIVCRTGLVKCIEKKEKNNMPDSIFNKYLDETIKEFSDLYRQLAK